MADKSSVAQHCESSGRKANDAPGFSRTTSGILCLAVASQHNKNIDKKEHVQARLLAWKRRLSTDLFTLLLDRNVQ